MSMSLRCYVHDRRSKRAYLFIETRIGIANDLTNNCTSSAKPWDNTNKQKEYIHVHHMPRYAMPLSQMYDGNFSGRSIASAWLYDCEDEYQKGIYSGSWRMQPRASLSDVLARDSTIHPLIVDCASS